MLLFLKTGYDRNRNFYRNPDYDKIFEMVIQLISMISSYTILISLPIITEISVPEKKKNLCYKHYFDLIIICKIRILGVFIGENTKKNNLN